MFAATRRVLSAALFALLLAAAAAPTPAASRAIALDAVAGADDQLLVSGVAERRRLVQYRSAGADDRSAEPLLSPESVEDLLSGGGGGGPDISL